ncbi:MAG: diguanylate cyclase [Proteobacteria bacterium]|nr:diguanylate cyclase [Pseudomonadota bacterium]
MSDNGWLPLEVAIFLPMLPVRSKHSIWLITLLGAGLAWAADAPPGPHPAIEYLERATIEMRTDPEASKRDADAALKLLGERPDVDLQVQAHLLLCDYFAERDTAAAEREIDAGTALLPNAHRKGLKAGLLDCRGQIFETAGNNAKARALYEQAVTVAAETHDDDMLAQSLFSRGYLLGLEGEYASGLSDLRRAETLYEKLRKPVHGLTVMNSIATLYNRMGDYGQAVTIYSRALKAQREAGMQREVAVTLHNLGRAYENLHEWDESRKSFAGSLAVSRQLAYPRGEAYALRGLAAVANASGDPKGALETLARAEVLQSQTPDARLRAQIQLARGIAYHKLDKLPESTAALEDALRVFRQADAMNELNATYSELAEVYAESGNWRAAYDRRTQAKETSDRLLNNQLDQRFATLKVEFDTTAKDKENALLIHENAINQQALAQAQSLRHLQGAVILLSVTLGLVLAMLAIHQRRHALRMKYLALTDELTHVPNRRSVLSRLDPLLRDPEQGTCAALIVDVDHFKKINDQFGHPTGDEVLKAVATTVRNLVAEPGFFGRLGGEEFLIVLPRMDLGGARRAAEQFREAIMAIDTSRWCSDHRRVTASLGCAVSNPGADTPSTMLKRADFALYAAKRNGRNCVETEPKLPADPTPGVDSLAAEA